MKEWFSGDPEIYKTEEMPCWYYEKKDLKVTPSVIDGISLETESRYRKEGSRFIMTCGTNMSLGHNTVATGVVYFHRFYMFHSFKTFPRYVTACCCLFLAGKVEETPKKCKDIIKTARSMLTDDKFFSFGEDPKEEVMTLERILLQTIKFDLQVEHPYSFLVKYAKCLKGDQTKLQKMVQMAWNFLNDSLTTTVCLQWEPEIIAVAMIHLASKFSKFTVIDWIGRQPHHLRWWDMFVADVTMDILEDICHQVLDLFQSHNKINSSSPPQQPPSRASPPRKPASESSLRKISPARTTVAANTKNQAAAKEEKLEGNPIPKLIPPPDPATYIYPTTNFATTMYTQHAPNFGGISSAPAPQPPMPNIYGTQYPTAMSNPQVQHYPPIAPGPSQHPMPLPNPNSRHHQGLGGSHHHPMASHQPAYYNSTPQNRSGYSYPPQS